MTRTRAALMFVAVVAATITATAQQGGRQWPPRFNPANSDTSVLSPEDKRTVFLDGLVLPRALKVLESGVLVAEPPHLWFARDTNNDLKADTKELVCDCYGFEMGNVEHNANSLLWAMDNWIYTSEGEAY